MARAITCIGSFTELVKIVELKTLIAFQYALSRLARPYPVLNLLCEPWECAALQLQAADDPKA